MKKVIVFGGAGFLGSHVADILLEEGYEVTIFDMKTSPYIKTGHEMIVGDILDFTAVQEAVKGAQAVYNFAGIADLDDAVTKPIDTVLQNIEGTVNTLEASKNAGVERFIYASSIYVYSDKGGFYRCSKQSAELYIEEYQKRYGLDYTILRYGTVYGPRSDTRNSVHRYLKQAIEERRIAFSGTGEEIREYIHVRDAAQLSVEVLSKKHRNQHVIITGHHPMKFNDFIAMVREILGNAIAIDYMKVSPRSAHYNVTPYSFIPKIGYKLTTNCYVDMGQGLLECISEINHAVNRVNKENIKI